MKRDASKKAINNKGKENNTGDKELGQFYSPPWLSKLCNEILEKPKDKFICEPTIGRGALLSHLDDSNVIHGYDIDNSNVLHCKNNFKGVFCHEDVLQSKKTHKGIYDYVISNPPFNINSFDKKELHELGGRAPEASTWRFIQNNHYMCKTKSINIVNESVLKRKDIMDYFIKNNLIEAIYFLPTKTFMFASVETVLIVTSKVKVNTAIYFYNLRDLEYEYDKVRTGYREYNNRWYYKKQLKITDEHFNMIKEDDEKITRILFNSDIDVYKFDNINYIFEKIITQEQREEERKKLKKDIAERQLEFISIMLSLESKEPGYIKEHLNKQGGK